MNSDEIEIAVESVAQGGRGFARIAGKATFIVGGLPGERVVARIKRRHAQYDEAEVLSVLESPHRHAPCSHAAECGGCDWMRWSEEGALQAKSELVRHDLEHVFGSLFSAWHEPAASPQAVGYRSRITLKLGEGAVGYYAQGTHELVSIDDCLVAVEPIRRALMPLRADARRLTEAGVEEVELRAHPADDKPLAIFKGRMRGKPPHLGYLRGIAIRNRTFGDCRLTYRVNGVELVAGPRSFTQVNLAVNESLVGAVVDLAAGATHLVDSYGGMGNFGIPLAHAGKNVLVLEGSAHAVRDGMANAARHGLSLQWREVPEAEMGAAWQDAGFPSTATLLLDPPRAGARRFLKNLFTSGLRPAHIIYVSCEPSTLVRDLRTLADQGYQIDWVRCFDMFPQTHHVETVVRLRVA